MKDFEFLHNITVGQFLPTGSRVHALHPATKMLATGIAVVSLIIVSSLSSLVVAMVLVAWAFGLARIPLAHAFRGIRPALPIIVLVALLQILFVSQNDGGSVFWQGWIISITARDFYVAAVAALRLVALVQVISLFTLCTAAKEVTHGTERILRPLGRVGFPAHELALVVTITLRFLPILSAEAEHLVKAQVSRGADFGRGRMGLFKRLFRLFPLLIPLFIASLRRGENLALAMEARGYTGGRERTQLIRFRSGRSDVVAAVLSGLSAAAILTTHFCRLDVLIWSWIT